MTELADPIAVQAADITPRTAPSNDPEPFASRMAGRINRAHQPCARHRVRGRAGSGDAHQLLNPTSELVVHLEVGDRISGDTATSPDDDLETALVDDRWVFTHEDYRPD